MILTPAAAAAAANAARVHRNYSLRWWEVGALSFPVAALSQVVAVPLQSHGYDHRPALSLAQVRADPALPWRGHWNDIRHHTLRLTGVFASKQFLRNAFDIFGPASSTLEDFSRNFAAGGVGGIVISMPWYMTELHAKRVSGGARGAKLPPNTFSSGWNLKNPTSLRLIEFTRRNGWWGRGSAHAGAGLASMRELVHRGLYFGVYDTVTAHHSDMGFVPRIALAYAVAFGSGVMAQPLAEMHERTQYWRGPDRKYANVREAYKKLTAAGGPVNLWRGSVGRLARTAVPHALLLVGVDALKHVYWSLLKRDDALPKHAVAGAAELAAAKPGRVHYPIAGTSKAAATTTAQATTNAAATP